MVPGVEPVLALCLDSALTSVEISLHSDPEHIFYMEFWGRPQNAEELCLALFLKVVCLVLRGPYVELGI